MKKKFKKVVNVINEKNTRFQMPKMDNHTQKQGYRNIFLKKKKNYDILNAFHPDEKNRLNSIQY